MSSIGDKKVALSLSNGTSVNLNKPTVLDSTVTSFLGLKNGEYCGVCTYSTPEYNSDIFMSSIIDFPFPIFRKGTEATDTYDSNYYYAKCPTDVNFYLKVMDFVGNDDRNTQLYALQLRGENEEPVAGDYADFPANGWDNGLYIGRSYYDNPAPASLNDEANNGSTDRVENNKIAWVLVPDQAVIKDMLPDIQDYTFNLDNNGVFMSDENSVASARVADYLADAINLRNLSEGADLNTCLTTGKYVMNGITVVNGPVAVEGADGNTRYSDNTTYDDSYTKTTPTMNHAVMTVEYLSVNSNGLIQTIVSDDFSVRRLITGLKNTSTRLLTIEKPDMATTFGPWVSLVEDNLTSTSTTAALSARMGFELNNKINDLETNKLDKSDVVDSLTSTDSKKPLSSLQGNVLNTRISNLNDSKMSYTAYLNEESTGIILARCRGPEIIFCGNGALMNTDAPARTNFIAFVVPTLNGGTYQRMIDLATNKLYYRTLSATDIENSDIHIHEWTEVTDNTKQNKPTISAGDLIAGTDSLTTGEFYFVYE